MTPLFALHFNPGRFLLRVRGMARLAPVALAGVLCAPSAGHAAAGSLPGYVILPLSHMGRANQACIRVAINGQPTMLMLDTGAPRTLLDTRFYQGARSKAETVDQDQLPPGVPRKTSANGQSAEVGYISSMKAGAMDFGKGPVIVTDLSVTLNQFNNLHHLGAVAGLLGEDILHRYNALIDWRRRGVYFNTDPSKRMNVGHAFVSAGWTAVPMSPTNGHHFSVACAVDGKPVRLLVDTGAQFTTFNKGIIPLDIIYNRDTGGSMQRLASMGGTAAMVGSFSTLYPARVEHLRIGNYDVQHINVAVHQLPQWVMQEQSDGEGPMLGLLGAEILASNSAIIDIAGSTLYLKPAGTR